MPTHIRVDRNLCMGNGQCVAAAPGLFNLTEEGELLVLSDPIPDALVPEVELAVRLCPTQALHVEER